MVRKIRALLMLSLGVCSLVSAQEKGFMYLKDKTCNFGFRVGFNSTLPVITQLTADDEAVTNYQIQYKVGYLAALSMRVNLNRFFITPTVSWYYTESELDFALPKSFHLGDEELQTQSRLDNAIHLNSSSVEIPVLIGYDLIKENPYRLSAMIGPKLKYQYRTGYDIHTEEMSNCHFVTNDHPYNVNLVAGLDVTIGRLFLDFTYELGITRTSSTFEYSLPDDTEAHYLRYQRRTNSLSFALGILF